jgi:hypothetical protein
MLGARDQLLRAKRALGNQVRDSAETDAYPAELAVKSGFLKP